MKTNSMDTDRPSSAEFSGGPSWRSIAPTPSRNGQAQISRPTASPAGDPEGLIRIGPLPETLQPAFRQCRANRTRRILCIFSHNASPMICSTTPLCSVRRGRKLTCNKDADSFCQPRCRDFADPAPSSGIPPVNPSASFPTCSHWIPLCSPRGRIWPAPRPSSGDPPRGSLCRRRCRFTMPHRVWPGRPPTKPSCPRTPAPSRCLPVSTSRIRPPAISPMPASACPFPIKASTPRCPPLATCGPTGSPHSATQPTEKS